MIRRTIKELIYQHKIVFYSLLINLPKVGLRDVDKPVAKFKHQRRIHISPGTTLVNIIAVAEHRLGYGNDIEVVNSDVKETG